MKIAVIFTGGTIGSTIKGGYANVDEEAKFALLQPFLSDPEVEFVPFSPYFVLSENLSAHHINLLQNQIEACLEKDFDGIVVTHGTDTLQYAAVAAELAFSTAPIPIVFVSASFPLEDPKTNGFVGFKAALELIKTKKAAGVFVSFRNRGENFTMLHIPSRLLQYREGDPDLFSLDSSPFASYENSLLIHRKLPPAKRALGMVRYVSDSGILCVESRPGNGFFYPLDGVRTILFSPYHSGTLPTENPEFVSFCLRAKKENIPMFVTGSTSAVPYASTALYEKLGILPLAEPFISSYMKIWAAISCGERPDAFIKENAE